MTNEQAKEILSKRRRHNIRYVMFRIKEGTEYNDDMPEDFRGLIEPIMHWYEQQPGFLGWESFSKKWDIGIDEPEVLQQRWWGWLDSQWYTFGISKLVAVKNPGLPYIVGDAGVLKTVTPAGFFIHNGYAYKDGNDVIPDINAMLKDKDRRVSWL